LRETGSGVVVVVYVLTEVDGQRVTQSHDLVGPSGVRHGCCRICYWYVERNC
jgi:hypothetical protein